MQAKNCKHCGTPLVIKQTKRTPVQLLKSYYYTAYYYCPRCRKMYLDDKFKVVNQTYDLFMQDGLGNEPVDVEIWTDGACTNNGRENARAAWAFVSGEFEKAGLVEGKQTNNTAEAYGIYYALLWAAEKGYQRIKIYSDSQITIHNLQKSLGKIKANAGIFKKIFDLIQDKGLQVVYKKVAGHAGVADNERVDKLANELAQSGAQKQTSY